MLTDLKLLDQMFIDKEPYYKIIDNQPVLISKSPYSIDFELSKFKKATVTPLESLLRQIKLLQSIRSSGEEDKLIELIDKWECVTRDVVI